MHSARFVVPTVNSHVMTITMGGGDREFTGSQTLVIAAEGGNYFQMRRSDEKNPE